MPRRASVLGLLLTALMQPACGAGSGARDATPADAASFDAGWLDDEGPIEPRHLSRVAALGERDPEASALFSEAAKRLGNGSVEGLAARFSVCPRGTSLDAGLTVVRRSDAYVARTLEELATGKRPADQQRRLAELSRVPAREVRLVERKDYVVVERTLLPEICIVPRLSLVEAYEAVVHELVHALRTDPQKQLDGVLGDEAAYLEKLVLDPGGEVEAYAASTRARLRLGDARRTSSPIRPFFDPRTGDLLVGPRVLADTILAPRPKGLGYAEGLLRSALARSRRDLFDHLSLRHRFVSGIVEERRSAAAVLEQNLEIHTHNMKVRRHNAAAGKARGDRGLTARSEAELRADERELAKTRAMLDAARASELRLVAELGDLRARLDELSRVLAEGP